MCRRGEYDLDSELEVAALEVLGNETETRQPSPTFAVSLALRSL